MITYFKETLKKKDITVTSEKSNRVITYNCYGHYDQIFELYLLNYLGNPDLQESDFAIRSHDSVASRLLSEVKGESFPIYT